MPMLAPLSPESLWELGRSVHSRLPGRAGRTLDPSQFEIVTHLAELILPETDTPGATSVRVPAFIDLMLTEWYSASERDQFLAGLAEIDARSRRVYGGVFLDLRASDQEAMLQAFDGGQGVEGSAEYTFQVLKQLTVYGYFTSERVMKEVTREPTIPRRFDGCTPL